MKQSGSREVNNLLHNLRGEQYRQLRNVGQSGTRVSTSRTYTPTLPYTLTSLEYESSETPAAGTTTPVTYSGPAPPKSWKPSSAPDDRDTIALRTRALSIAASHLGNFTERPRVPSLALLCLKIILLNCTSKTEFQQDIVPYIPFHLRRDVIRYCAIHSPLPNWKLHALFSPQGNADGEVLIMGPSASISQDHFAQAVRFGDDSDPAIQAPSKQAQLRDWEAEETVEEPLLSLILVSTRLPTSTFFALPPTITRLALIDLPVSIPVHRLPKLCPMLVLLDLSYNSWLKDPTSEGVKSLEKTPWNRWKNLEIVGLRDCSASDELLKKINAGRWDDVNIILE